MKHASKAFGFFGDDTDRIASWLGVSQDEFIERGGPSFMDDGDFDKRVRAIAFFLLMQQDLEKVIS